MQKRGCGGDCLINHFRYAVRLLTPSKVMAHQNGNESVTVEDVREAADLFIDAKTSAQMLAENPEKFMKWVKTFP